MSLHKIISKLESPKKKLRVAVVDDDRVGVDYLAGFINMTDGFELVLATTNPMEGLAQLQEKCIDVVFLDIEMPVMNGLVFLSQLNVKKATIPSLAHIEVVVCSGYDEALKSYDYKIADYLTKPILFDRYMKAVKEVNKRLLPMDRDALLSELRVIQARPNIPLAELKLWTKLDIEDKLNMSDSTYRRNLSSNLLNPMRLTGADLYFEQDIIDALEQSRRKGRI